MSLTNFPNGVSSFGIPMYGPGELAFMGMGRAGGSVTGKNKVIFVDSQAAGDATGRDWTNAMTTVQAGVNAARRDYGTTDINYDDDRQCFVIVAPGNYAERVAFSAKNVHLIGLGIPGTDNGTTLAPSAPSTFGFAFGGNGCELANFCIPISTAVFGMYLSPPESCRVHDIYLQGNGAGTYGMYIDETGLKGTQIFDCIIDSFITCGIYAATGASAYAIQGKIFHNVIGGVSVKGIDIDILTAYAYNVWQNWITGTTSASIECSSTGILVADNWVDRQPSGTLTARDNHYSSAGA